MVNLLQLWSSGMMLACHAGDPGSIPGSCSFSFLFQPPPLFTLFFAYHEAAVHRRAQE